MAIPALYVVGAALMAVGGAVASATKDPDDIKAGTGDVKSSLPIEEKIAKFQYDSAVELSTAINDPRVMETILSQLPEEDMDQETLNMFAGSVAENKATLGEMGLRLQEQAMGQKLDDLVDRGVMTSEQAQRQKVKTTAAVNAVIRIHGKKLEAFGKKAALSYGMKKNQVGMGNASLIGEVDSRNRAIYNRTISTALNNMTRKKGASVQNATRVAYANMKGDMMADSTKNDFWSNFVNPMGGGSSGGGGGGMDWSSFYSGGDTGSYGGSS